MQKKRRRRKWASKWNSQRGKVTRCWSAPTRYVLIPIVFMNNSTFSTKWIAFDNDDDDVVYYGRFFFLLTAALRVSEDVSPNQMHQVTLDPVEETRLTWMVDWPEKNVFFQVKNGVNDRYSWFAIGFSRRGDFPRTDFCFFQRDNERVNINIVSDKSLLTHSPRGMRSPFYKLETFERGWEPPQKSAAVDIRNEFFSHSLFHSRMHGQATMGEI